MKYKRFNFFLASCIYVGMLLTMPTSSKQSCLAVLRDIAGLTQRELAEIVGCAGITIQSVELGKLALSRRLAERISLHTGVDVGWLLAGDYKAPPVCLRDPGRLFTKKVYETQRADIEGSRTDPGDLVQACKVWETTSRLLARSLLRAYRENKLIYYYYKLREFREDFEAEFPLAPELQDEAVAEFPSKLYHLLETAAGARKK
jgi:transcriptional regulator with XRE-family HTH domain